MEEERGDVPFIDIIEDDIAALQQKLQEDFAQMESAYLKAKTLSEDWLEAQQRLKAEGKQMVLEASTDHLNVRREEAEAALEAELSRTLASVREKEAVVAKLRGEVVTLEQKVEAAYREVAQSAARLEEGTHSASLALEASLDNLLQHLAQKLPGTKHPEEGTGAGDPTESTQVPPLQEDVTGQTDCPGPQEPPLLEEDSQST